MLVSFNPAISRQQNPNFGLLTPAEIKQITRTAKEAEMFEMGIAKGKTYAADEIKQLRDLIPQLKKDGKLEVAALINRALNRL